MDAEDATFSTLWSGHAKRALVVDVPGAVREDLLRFLPPDGQLPHRLQKTDTPSIPISPEPPPPQVGPEPAVHDPRRTVWTFIHAAPTLPDGGERVGEVTCAINP